MNIFVHLARDKDPLQWRAALQAGTLVGRNDETPYGYGRASSSDCRLVFSTSVEESTLQKLVRLAFRVILGFDYVHARRQRDAILAADVVWTHTESQFLGVAAVVNNWARRPKLIGQAVWLFDRWPSLTSAHKALFRRLFRNVDVLTTHSHLNASLAMQLLPNTRVMVVPFGIPSENPIAPHIRSFNPIRIVSVGNDRHRDWLTLIQAFGNAENYVVEIISSTASQALVRNMRNITVRRITNNSDLTDAYSNASVAVIPLKPNLHASGATVLQEAVLAGIPVVVTDAGGLRGYFDDTEVTFVPTGVAQALRDAVASLVSDSDKAQNMAVRAQSKMADGVLGADAYIKRHVDLSKELMT